MTITVSGKKRDYDEGLTVAKLIEAEDVENPLYVTVSVNEQFVNQGQFATTELHDGDAVEFLYLMGGGR